MSAADGAGELFAAARQVHANAYVPYCRFPVAAAIRSASGHIYCGVNVDNRSPAHTACAEANALGAMIAAGEREIVAVLVLAGRAGDGMLCTPCGGCRQRLAEYAGPDARLHLCDQTGVVETLAMRDVLPLGFAGDTLR